MKIKVLSLLFGFALLIFLIARTLEYPLTGTHKVRQADTLFTGYSYCIGDSTFWYPKIAHREGTSGIAIGEFPLFSYLLSLPCQWTGVWSEIPPKGITYGLWILCLLIWNLWYQKRSPNIAREHPLVFTLFFAFSPLLLTYLLIPIPDVLAVLLAGLAGLCWQHSRRAWALCGALLFTLSFLIRPYLFPLILLLAPHWNLRLLTLCFCGMGYLFWFKYWIKNTEIWYYLTDTKSIGSLFEGGWITPKTFLHQILLNHLNYIGILPFWLGLQKHRDLMIAWFASLAFVLILKGDHFVHHAYYFMAAGLIGVVLLCEGYSDLSAKKQKLFFPLFVLMGIMANQHLWRPPVNQRPWTLPALIATHQVPFTEKIAVYDTFDPQTLYLARRVGWYFEKNQWQGPEKCPIGAQWALIFDSQDKPALISCLH